MKILIGYDGSVDADGAIHDLELAGLPAEASVLVLTLSAPWEPLGPEGQMPPGYGAYLADYRDEALSAARELAERGAAQVGSRFPQWKVKAEAALLQPAAGLLARAEKWKPHLIVLGSHGRTALGRMLLGSVSQNVLHHAVTDVRITRPRIRAKEGPPHVLVAVDGSKGSRAAVAAVAARSWPRKTEIRVAGVLGDMPKVGKVLYGGSEAYESELAGLRRAQVEEVVSAAAEAVAAAGHSVEQVVLKGDPRAAIVKEAKAWGADSLFLGCRGLAAVERFLMGSVSSWAAAHAPCTVEVVRKARPLKKKG
jgi:nucleotide-binding universal stress UspA family protein